ncbi:MAG: flagellar export chaperone FliS [Deltaproteobacteria bacterium]
MNNNTRQYQNYQNVQILTADRVKIIIMLYDGVIRFNKLAQSAIEEGDIENRALYINKSHAILGELYNSLNMQAGGEIARNLARLYEFSISELNVASFRNDPAPLGVVNRVIAELKLGWEKIANENNAVAPEHAHGQRGSVSNGI